MITFSKLLAASLLLGCALCASARADTVVITSGTVSQQGFSSHTFDLSGQGFRAGGWGDSGHAPCSPCQAGDTISINNNYVGESELHWGPATVGGVDYAQLYYTGTLTLSASPFVMPADDSALVTLTLPFTLSGNLNGYTLNPFVGNPGPAVFSSTLTGQGIATLELSSILTNQGRLYWFRSLTYNFQPASVPEPATLTLLATGLGGALAASRRRRRTSRSNP